MIVLISFCVCAALPCVLSQVTLVESGPGVLRPSESLRMGCTISGVSITSSSYLWDWIRQPPGKGLEWLARIYYDDSKWYAAALQNRLSISKDDSKNEYYLQMNNMKTDDTAVYYCVTEAGAFDYWGQGTLVTVTTEPISAPTVFPLIPCCGSLPSQGQITIGCLATGYMPDPVEVTWNSGAITAGIKTPPSVYIAGRYMRSSQLTVPAAEAINGSYLCSIAHQYTGLKQNKAVKVLPCSPPLVKVLVSPPCDVPLSNIRAPSEVNATMEVVCLISDFYPGYLQVQWLANGKPTTSPGSAPAPVRGTDGRFAASSQLTVRKGEWNQGTTYTCQVTHPTTGPNSLLNISKCAETCPSHMGVYLIPPSFEDLYLKKAAHVTCLVTNMKTTESFEVLWEREKGVKLEVVTEDPQLHDNGTSSVVSRLAICVEDWQSGEKYTCTLKHPDLPSPLKVAIIRHKESSPRPPAVYLLPPHPEELSLLEQVSIICHVKDFNPKDIFVKWLHKGNEVSAGSYTTTDPMPSLTGGSYYLYSTIVVDATEWNKGDSYSCVVGHEDLPYFMVQKSIDKFTDFADILYEVDAYCDEDDSDWTTMATFMMLFLLSLSYSATITLFKVKLN